MFFAALRSCEGLLESRVPSVIPEYLCLSLVYGAAFLKGDLKMSHFYFSDGRNN